MSKFIIYLNTGNLVFCFCLWWVWFVIKILFTGVGRRVELIQAFKEASLVLGKDLKIYGADLTGTAPALAFCDFTRIVLPMKDDRYIDNLLSICKSDSIDLVIPTIDTDLLVLSENIKKFEEIGTKVMISSPDMIKICRDKNFTSQFFIACGLNAPMPVSDWTTYNGGFPAFIKPKDGSSSINAFKVNNIDELESYSKQIDNYVVQPYVDGKEYTIDIFCDWYGTPISIVPRERLQVRAGEVLKTQIFLDKTMIAEAQKICDKFKPCGAITVQLIQDRISLNNYYIEINPRFGGGAPLSMKAGAKTAEAILHLISNEPVHDCFCIAEGAVYSRFDQSVCINEGTNDIRGVIFDLDDTLYSEMEYINSGFKAIADYLGESSYYEKLLSYFRAGKAPIDELLVEIGMVSEKANVLDVYRLHEPCIELYDGVKELLSELRSRGIKTGIITDGRPEGQRKKIKALGLCDMIDDVIVTDELGGVQFRKPCDISFRIMQTKWRLSASHLIYIADNFEKDFQAPQQLGIGCIWLKNMKGLYNCKTGNIFNCRAEYGTFIDVRNEILKRINNDQ